ncbi:MAG: hypothetical protein HRT92_10345 [Piscirickettsiaceae bacterium]|nr:hypothetical protein [Piscirickettsiaceae bacterium]
MPHFSEIFNINRTQAELDFVDITPGSDTRLYLDPYALTTRDDDWSIASHEMVISFFQAVLEAVKNGQKPKALLLLSHLGEPEETHLGVSIDGNSGRGVGGMQASEVYSALSKSKAATSGLMEDLSDFALFIPGIGRDKISDITTNVIRKQLISYTQSQCVLHDVPMRKVPSGFFWCSESESWRQEYVELPVHNSAKLLLVPKYSVRYQVGVDHTQFRKMFVLEFLQAEHLRAGDSLVTTLLNNKGEVRKKVVYKKTVDEHYPTEKDFLAQFSIAHPEVIDKYRDKLKSTASKIPNISGENFQEADLASQLKRELSLIEKGKKHADLYHNYCISVISFLFFPNLINPKKEGSINDGRKRIDIRYTNGKHSGFFYRAALDQHLVANTIHIECKNYTNEIDNPALDQLIGRYDLNRGRVGMLFFRESDNLQKLIKRCGDAAIQRNGLALPIDDNFIIRCLEHIENNERVKIDIELDNLYQKVIS